MTIQERLIRSGGNTAGFDYLRIALALGVFVWHGVFVSYPLEEMRLHRPFVVDQVVALILPMFFVLSGFLVAGSLERSRTLVTFLSLRALRILPALATEIILSALVLGPLVTDQDTAAYFGDPGFASYFLNIVGDIHYHLPGVFDTNPLASIMNQQLWTIPFELECYIALAALASFGLHRQRRTFVAVIILWQLFYVARSLTRDAPTELVGFLPGRMLVLHFLFGVAMFLYRDRIVHSWILGFASAVVVFLLLSFPLGHYYMALPASYLTVYLGTFNPRRIAILRSGDYSYGIYLYSFPIQQTVIYLCPWSHNWAINVAVSTPFVAGFAMLSWHGPEKRALRLRRYIPHLENALDQGALWLLSRLRARTADDV